MFGHDKRSLGQLLNTPIDGKEYSYFQVPKYQRKYEWEKENQVLRLVEDIFENIGQTYFMGPIIVCSPQSTTSNSVELIDGQQRIATLAMFIRALIDYIHKRKTESAFPVSLVERMNKIQYELINKIIKGGLVQSDIVIHLARKINPFFRDNILMSEEPNKTEKLKALAKGEHPSILKLIDAYNKIWEYLENRYNSENGEGLVLELLKLASSILHEKLLLVVSVENKSDAYTIFESINARGKPLTLSDLVKNLFFEKIEEELGPDRLEDFESEWDEAEIAVSDFASFMWHAWVSRNETCPKNKVYNNLEKLVKQINCGDAFDLATDIILGEVKFYHNYENPNDEVNAEKKRFFTMLKAMDATRCYPLLLSIDWAIQKDNIATKEAIKLLHILTCLTFWYSGICSKDAKKLEAIYHDLARKARTIKNEDGKVKTEEIIEELIKQFPSDAECEASFMTKRFTDSGFIKMVLRNIELNEYKKVETTLKDPAKVQLEHILPRNPDPVWKEYFPDEKEMRENTYRFGNFTLLYQRLNEKARNGPFSEKKKHYEQSEIGLTNSLKSLKQWTATEVDNRTKELFKYVQKEWPIYSR